MLCRLKIVDFGSGSGNLILPLAHIFPACDFVAIDMKAEAIRILEERAAKAGLSNISAEVCRIEDYKYCSAMLLTLFCPPALLCSLPCFVPLHNRCTKTCAVQEDSFNARRDDFDVCLALHACGHATDVAMLQAHRSRAALVVSPCCVGKLVFSPTLGAYLASSSLNIELDSNLIKTSDDFTTITYSRLGEHEAGEL